MTFPADKKARFLRPTPGSATSFKQTTISVDISAGTHDLDDKCVAFRLVNASAADIFIRLDGTAATLATGWTLEPGADTGWIDCTGGGSFSHITTPADGRLDVIEVLE